METLKQKIEEAADELYPPSYEYDAFKKGAQFLLDEGVRFSEEDMVEFAEWFSRNWDLDFKTDAALKQWLEERRKNNDKSK